MICWSRRKFSRLEGDRNTKCFHQQASNRRHNNWIHKLKDNHGVLQEDPDAIFGIINNYFLDLFNSYGISHIDDVLAEVSLVLSQ